MASSTFSFVRLPVVTANDDNGVLTLSVEITGINPDRDLTNPERLKGYTSLNPPTIVAKTPQEAIRLANLCTIDALDATPDFEVTPLVLGWAGYAVGYAAAGALVALGYDA